jgi:hypothetical protein
VAPTIHLRERGKLLASSGPVIYAVRNHEAAAADPSNTDAAQTLAVIETLVERHPAIAILMVIEHGAQKPEPEERRKMQAILDQMCDRLIVGYAFCGLGFWAGALRSVLVGISRLSGSPIIAHATVEATAQHLASELLGLDPEQMTRECEALRAELAAELPSKLATG